MSKGLSGKTHLKYRSDIDGLRAVAVLSVLACHAEVPRMQGGFVGVDVFFVISGYLISSIILADIDASQFSILSFYERRIRRIFPALFAMLLIFTAFALVYFLPIELVGYCKSLLAATTSSSNFYFWQHSGYFDSPTSNPLLHTWSLAVEEQFYILFPLCLVLVRKLFPTRLRLSVVALFVVSLLISAVSVSLNRDTAFYMPYTRAWELLLGTILSLTMLPQLRLPWVRNIVSVAGAAMILYSVYSYSRTTPFPGFAALVPCIGTALIIWAGSSGKSVIGFLLSLRPVVFVGAISYSLYLYHWPVIILQNMGVLLPVGDFLRHGLPGRISAQWYSRIVMMVISLILAILSWRFIERPFRVGKLRLKAGPLFALAGAFTVFFAGLSVIAILAAGFKGRFPPASEQLASYLDNPNQKRTMREGSCFITSANHFENYDSSLCLHQDAKAANYLLLGDSHSAMLWSALSSSFTHANIMQASTSGCAPVLHSVEGSDCRKMMEYFYERYIPSHAIDGLLLEARWRRTDLARLSETVAWGKQHGVRVIIFGPVPEYDAPLPRLEAYSVAWKDPSLVRQHRLDAPALLDENLQELAEAWRVPYVSLYRAICSSDVCDEYADNERRVPLLFDDNHLTESGALLVVHRLIDRGELWLGEDRAKRERPEVARFSTIERPEVHHTSD